MSTDEYISALEEFIVLMQNVEAASPDIMSEAMTCTEDRQGGSADI